MKLSFRMERLPELRTALMNLPAQLKLEAGSKVVARADRAAARIRSAYPDHGTGALRRGVGVRAVPAGATHGAKMLVRSSAHHAHLYEKGSRLRQTKKGWNRGRMTAFDVFIPIMKEERAILDVELRDVVENAGFQVRG